MESGVDPAQELGPAKIPVDISLEKIEQGIEAHPLPEALRNLAPAFRSHPAWLLIVEWVSQVTKESGETQQNLSRIRDDLQNEKVINATLGTRISGLRQVTSLKSFIIAIGTLLVGASTNFYKDHSNLFFMLLIVGAVMILVGWLLGRSKD